MSKLIVFYDSWCPVCIWAGKLIKKFDWLALIELQSIRDIKSGRVNIPVHELQKEMHCLHLRTGKVKKGIDAVAAVCARLPLFSILWLPIKVSGVLGFGKWIYRYVAENRKIIPTGKCTSDTCK